MLPRGWGGDRRVGPVGQSRDEVSKHADDGSLQLLMAPAVLVAVVLVMMLTACAGASGEEERAADTENVSAASADDEDGRGQILPPEVTEDGRMLQPEGHEGIWFETAPSDPLGKLVYESQRFVGDPVELDPIGERALLPQWEGMPDLCTGQVPDRLEELGVYQSAPAEPGLGIVACGGTGTVISHRGNMQTPIEWGAIEDLSAYEVYEESETDDTEDFVNGEMRVLGCTSFLSVSEERFYIYASTGEEGPEHGCRNASFLLRAVINVIGDSLD